MAAARRVRRRPNGPLVAVVLTMVVLVGTLASRALSGGDDARLAYLDEMRPMVEESTGHGVELTAVRSEVAELGRAGLARRLERLARETREVRDDVAAEEPPASLRPAHGLLVATLTVRARAAAAARAGFTDALGDRPPDQVTRTLASIGADLELADRTYQLFVETVPLRDRSALPASRWLTDPTVWEQGEVSALVSTLRSSTSLDPVRDVAVVTVFLRPAPVSRDGPLQILPLERSVSLDVVVANVGNAEERDVVVTARVAPATNAGIDRIEVDLEAGQRRTVFLGRSGRLRPLAGQPVTLTVTVGPVTDEGRTDDNQQVSQFLMR